MDQLSVTCDKMSGRGEPIARIMMNIAGPGAALRSWRLPAKGIGLARMEFIVNGAITIHPLAFTRFDHLDIHRREVGRRPAK